MRRTIVLAVCRKMMTCGVVGKITGSTYRRASLAASPPDDGQIDYFDSLRKRLAPLTLPNEQERSSWDTKLLYTYRGFVTAHRVDSRGNTSQIILR